MRRTSIGSSLALALGLATAGDAALAAPDRGIYADILAPGWEDNWSYDTVVDFENAGPVHGGAKSIAVSYVGAYAGFSIRISPPIVATEYSAIRFWIYGGLGGNQVDFYTQATDQGDLSLTVPVTATDGVWTQIVVPLTTLGSPAAIARINIQDATGMVGVPTYFIDDIELVGTGVGGFPDPVATRVLGQNIFDSSGDGISATQMHGPAGVAVGPDGRLFVVDFFNNRVLSWPSATTFANGQAADLVLGQANFVSNASGSALNRMNLPESVAVDPAGNVFVADTYNHRVMVFEPPLATNMSGTAFGTGTPDCAMNVLPEQLCFPRGIASDSLGNLYLADEFNYRVLIYQTPVASENYLPDRTIGGLGEPRGVAVDADGTLFVADSENDRVRYYEAPLTTDLVSDGSIGAGTDGVNCETQTDGMGVTATTLACPIDLALDPQGNLFVSDLYNHRILAFVDPVGGDGVADEVYGQQGSFTTGIANKGGISATSMRIPLGIAFDADGGLYLADFENNRVLAYPAPVPEPGALAAGVASVIAVLWRARRRIAR